MLLILSTKFLTIKQSRIVLFINNEITPFFWSSSPQVPGLEPKSLKCLVESKQHRLGDPCSPADRACTCWFRPVDRTLLLDCANRSLADAPMFINNKGVDKIELDLSMNFLVDLPSVHDRPGYEKIESLVLSRNRIDFIGQSLFMYPQLKVSLI